jgi:PAS domain S-box-containing protein
MTLETMKVSMTSTRTRGALFVDWIPLVAQRIRRRSKHAISFIVLVATSVLVVGALVATSRGWRSGGSTGSDPGLRLVTFAGSQSRDAVFGSQDLLIVAALAGALMFAVGLALAGRLGRRRIHHALKEGQRRHDQLAEQTSDVVFHLRNHRLGVSSSTERMFGHSAEDMRVLPLSEMIHPEDLQGVIEAYKCLDADRPRIDLTYRVLHKSGAIVWVEASFGRVAGDIGDVETIVTLRDVTKRQERAEALAVATREAQDAETAADQANRAKGDFLASMSHEIRTPLNAILGFANLLLSTPDLSSSARRNAERIKAGGNALLVIVSDILDFSQAESGALRLDPQPFALPLLVDECIALVEGTAVARNLALRVVLDGRFPLGVLGDEARLRQILLNLLNNAIKFTREGSVTLKIGHDRAAGQERILFEVVDTGIGIGPADIPHIFQRFRQVDGTIRRTYGGTGLGLAISKSLVDVMGGSIGVISEKGVGSTFWFALPLPAVELTLTPGVDETRKPKVRSLQILLVEDVAINQELVCAVLRARGHHVDLVGDGADAIMAVADTAYDLVLMDLQMPYVDGLSATRAIRLLQAPCRFVPIVALSANVLEDQMTAAIDAGMDGYLAKPLDFDALERVLERVAQETFRPAAVVDAHTLSALRDVIGDAKIEAKLTTLVMALSAQFTAPFSLDACPALKAEAHASIAGAAILGFKQFADRCRAFIQAEEEAHLVEAYAALRSELSAVVILADRLSRDRSQLSVRRAA